MTKNDIINTLSYTEKISPNSDNIFIISHGSNKGNDSSLIRGVADKLYKEGASVVTFNFSYLDKGAENSRGLVNELNDLWQVYNFVSEEHPDKKINLVGKSLGGIVASWLPSQKKVNPESISLMGCVIGDGGVDFGGYAGPVVIVQGEKDRYGNKKTVADFMKNYLGRFIIKEVPNSDHSYRNAIATNDTENYEVEAIDYLMEGLKEVGVMK
ncbi:MAG: hypothetical protein M1312_00735 [Patescibacteria group bacterium]|nr:hypothetical protein [Patescibacteria group bacterium]MDE2144877.1 hypothetical protein [Patescibacteria group bacterium]